MAFKIYKKNNYIIVEDTISGKQYQGLAKNVFIYKDTTTETTYDFEGLTYNGLKGISLSDIVDENNTTFANEQAFIDFYTTNTGNFNLGGGSPQEPSLFKGVIVPSDTPSGTGAATWETITAGTYTNFGGVVVTAGNHAIIARDEAGVFSISQSALISPNLVPTKETKRNIEFLDGMVNPNYFRTTDVLPGYIANGTNTFLTAPTAGQIVGRVELRAGTWAIYNVVTTVNFFIQRFKADGTYVGTTTKHQGQLNADPSFTLVDDGYILFNINYNVTTPLANFVVAKYDTLFALSQNLSMYGATTNVYSPYFKNIPKVTVGKTDNLMDLSKVEPYPSNGAYFSYTSAFIRVDTPIGTERYVSIYDDCRMYSPTKKLIVEFDVNGNEIAGFTQNITHLNNSYKQHKLNDSTTYFYFLLWKFNDAANYGNKGLITYNRLVQELRFNRGKYFTQEKTSDKITHINGLKVPVKINPLKGKVIASFGDSTMWEYPATGYDSVGSYMDKFRNDFECGLYNLALGQAGLTDWSDTIVDSVGGYATTSHNNVVSNQVEQLIAKGIIPDIVVLSGGTNDSLRSRSQGSLSTAITNYSTPASQDKQTFYGILFWAVKKLRDINPNVEIVFVKPLKSSLVIPSTGTPPPYSPATVNTNLIPIYECYENSAKELGCHIVDFSKMLNSIQVAYQNNDYTDYLHPTTESKQRLFRKVLPTVKQCAGDTIETY